MSASTDPGAMLIDGLAATQCVDSSGEIVDIAGVDTSALEGPDGIPLNIEHKANSIPVGEVVSAHKIFSDADVETDRQRYFWDLARHTPCIYVVCRLYDAAGNPEAVQIAAAARDRHARGLPLYVRYSVEGSTLRRDPKEPNRILESVWRALALTWKPCNKSAASGLLADPNPPDGFPVISKSEVTDLGSYIGGAVTTVCDPVVPTVPTADVIRKAAAMVLTHVLRKALDAGMPSGAPSSLTGGAALQRSDLRPAVTATLRDWGFKHYFNRDQFKAFAKHRLPDVSPDFLDHFADVAEHLRVQVRKAEGAGGDSDVAAGVLELAKATEDAAMDLRSAASAPGLEPEVYAVRLPVNGGVRHVGRFLVDNGVVHHLEDNHGLLATAAPEGPMSAFTAGRVSVWRGDAPAVLSHGVGEPVPGEVRVSQSSGDANGTAPEPATPAVEPEVTADPVRRAPVFHYHRAGMVEPHVVEFGPAGAALDGSELSAAEVQLMLQNVSDGLATLRYAALEKSVSERTESLAKADEPMSAVELLRHLRAGVAAGTIDPSLERAATHHLMVDPQTGLGNKLAYREFTSQNRPGVYVGGDFNDLKGLNDTQGHEAGDVGIGHMAAALRAASAKVGTIKSFRTGGDETVHYAPTFQDAAAFVHHAAQHLNSAAPIGGTHRPTMSFGLGHDLASADQALYAAKAQKIDPRTRGRAFPLGHTPNLAHSLVSGSEGAVPLHSEAPPRAVVPAVKPPV